MLSNRSLLYLQFTIYGFVATAVPLLLEALRGTVTNTKRWLAARFICACGRISTRLVENSVSFFQGRTPHSDIILD